VPELKLGKLPDRTPIKIGITITPALNDALRDYLALYRTSYEDKTASIADLIPAMLENFLASDKAFAKVRKAGPTEA
jgi:hypothetical protein